MSKLTIPRACKKCAYCYNKDYCLLKEEYIEDLRRQECDEKFDRYIPKEKDEKDGESVNI